MNDEARSIINRLLAAGCTPKLNTCTGWVEVGRPVDAVESRIFATGLAEYERVNPTGLRLVRSWDWFMAKFDDAEALRVKEMAGC